VRDEDCWSKGAQEKNSQRAESDENTRLLRQLVIASRYRILGKKDLLWGRKEAVKLPQKNGFIIDDYYRHCFSNPQPSHNIETTNKREKEGENDLSCANNNPGKISRYKAHMLLEDRPAEDQSRSTGGTTAIPRPIGLLSNNAHSSGTVQEKKMKRSS